MGYQRHNKRYCHPYLSLSQAKSLHVALISTDVLLDAISSPNQEISDSEDIHTGDVSFLGLM